MDTGAERLEQFDDAAPALHAPREEAAAVEPLDESLQRVADSAVKVVPDADAVSISLLELGGLRTAALADAGILAIDEEQRTAFRGPGLDAARGRQPVLSVLGAEPDDWPEFTSFDEGLMKVFTAAASAAISNAHRWQRTSRHVERLEFALISRARIEQAKGALMAAHGCTADDAFLRLVEQSQARNVKLREIAHQLLPSLRPG
ncbi:ANTAR domain-containing protein [Amycolatopsis sp.]|uniref:ANTAR domain-containing protein n=1 Tax=Amycolatopsis sp. TaxID=37632 RepID=UPI002B7F49D6|nr:ANTAR domain-containing protein [Amycolatopsis sp.]HVV09475.1 ANTAR domain-containing protein [Amycolatopsis sp.]